MLYYNCVVKNALFREIGTFSIAFKNIFQDVESRKASKMTAL